MDYFPAIWNGTLREHYLLLFSVAGSIALVAGFVGAWIGARLASRRLILELRESLPSSQQQEAASLQLSQLAQAVDVMALEVERLSEGQRFAARLLADSNARARREGIAHPPRSITPH